MKNNSISTFFSSGGTTITVLGNNLDWPLNPMIRVIPNVGNETFQDVSSNTSVLNFTPIRLPLVELFNNLFPFLGFVRTIRLLMQTIIPLASRS